MRVIHVEEWGLFVRSFDGLSPFQEARRTNLFPPRTLGAAEPLTPAIVFEDMVGWGRVCLCWKSCEGRCIFNVGGLLEAEGSELRGRRS